MNPINTPERARASEDEYVRRREAEHMAWSREVDRISRERAALAAALDERDTETINQLYACGLRASTVAVVEWLPAVEVAWVDGADVAERHALRTQFVADQRSSDGGVALLDAWLTDRPPEGFFAAGRQALRSHLRAFDDDSRRATLARIVATCEAVGRASGGTFGIGSLSSVERRRIERIRRDLE